MNAQPRHSITFALTAVFAAMWAVAAADEPLQPQANAATAGLRGRIVRLAADEAVVEIIVRIQPVTRIVIDNRVVRFNELGAGTEVSVAFITEGDRLNAQMISVVGGGAIQNPPKNQLNQNPGNQNPNSGNPNNPNPNQNPNQ